MIFYVSHNVLFTVIKIGNTLLILLTVTIYNCPTFNSFSNHLETENKSQPKILTLLLTINYNQMIIQDIGYGVMQSENKHCLVKMYVYYTAPWSRMTPLCLGKA